jgi:predicted RNase H-like HicB family nuclease
MKKSATIEEAEYRAKKAYEAWLVAEAQAGETFSEGKPTSTHEQAMSEFDRAIERNAKKAA